MLDKKKDTEIVMFNPKRNIQDTRRDEYGSAINYRELGFGFKDLLVYTKKAQKLQKKIDKELECENTGGLVKITHSLWGGVKKAAGAKVRTLDDLYGEQHDIVRRLCAGLYGLQQACNAHYMDMVSFRESNNNRLHDMHSIYPAFERQTKEWRKKYAEACRELSTVRKSNPRYYKIREVMAKYRDILSQASHEVALGHNNEELIDKIAVSVDTAAKLLLHGKSVVDMVAEKYFIADSHLQRLPALNFARNMMRDIKFLYESNKVISTAVRQAGTIVTKLENPRLLVRLSRDIPSLPSSINTADALDYLNSELSSRRDIIRRNR
jgi:hypothetical protein